MIKETTKNGLMKIAKMLSMNLNERRIYSIETKMTNHELSLHEHEQNVTVLKIRRKSILNKKKEGA